MSDRIARSVAFTLEVDQALEALAHAEGTSRADLVREALTMLFDNRGLPLDAQAGIVTDRVAVSHQRNRRRAAIGDQARAALEVWWHDTGHEVTAASRDPELLEAVVEQLILEVERDGTVPSGIATRIAGPNATYADTYAVDDAVRELIAAGVLEYQRKRGQPARIRVAPSVG